MHADVTAPYQLQFTEVAETSIARLDPQMRIRITGRIRNLVASAEGIKPTVDFRNVRFPLTLSVNRTTVAYDLDPDHRALTVLWVECEE